MLRRRIKYAALAALCCTALSACASEAAPERAPVGVAVAAPNPLVLVPGWVIGSSWPTETVVALDSVWIRDDAQVVGDVAVIRSHSGPYLNGDYEGVVSPGALVSGSMSADSLWIKDAGVIAGNATYNDLSSTGTIQGNSTQGLTVPMAITVPTFAEFTAGTQDEQLAASEQRTLAAGSYDQIQLEAGTFALPTRLTLSGGDYFVREITTSQHGRIECAAACRVFVKERIDVGDLGYLGPSAAGGLVIDSVQLIVEGINGEEGTPSDTPLAADFRDRVEVKAFIFVPNGTLRFRNDSVPLGKFVARHVEVGKRALARDGTGYVQPPGGWVTGATWPQEAIVVLNSMRLTDNSQAIGDLAAILHSSGPVIIDSAEVSVGQAATVTGSIRGDTVFLRANSIVTGDVTTNGVAGTGIVQGQVITPMAYPLPITAPAVPSATAGTTVIDQAGGVDSTIAAGSYDLITLRQGTSANPTVLTLSGGLYAIRQLDLQSRSRVECLAPCNIVVKERLTPGASTYIGPAAGSTTLIGDVRLFVEGANGGTGGPTATPRPAEFGSNADIQAMVFVPNGTLNVASGSQVKGCLMARDLLLSNCTTRAVVVILTHPEALTVDERKPAVFTVVAVGKDVTYQWQKDGVDIPGATGTTFSIASAELTDAGDYRVVVTGDGSAATSRPATLTVNQLPPVITVQPQSQSVCGLEDVTLSCDALGSGVTYQWEDANGPLSDGPAADGHTVSGSQTQTLVLGNVQANTSGSYLCKATNPAGTDTSAAALLTVGQIVPQILALNPQSAEVEIGASFTLSVTATGQELAYQWQRFGTPIAGATSATYTNTQAQLSDDGATYSVVVSNTCGSVSGDVPVAVVDDTGPQLNVNNAPTITLQEDTITVTGTATDTGSGVQQVAVESDKYPGQDFGAVLDQAGNFTGDVPLEVGVNVLTVVTKDAEGNETRFTITVTVTVTEVPRVLVGSPSNGSTVTTDRVNVTGKIRSSLPANEIRLRLGAEVTFPTGTAPEYSFHFDSVPLLAGPNTLTVLAETTHGNASAATVVTYDDSLTSPPPSTPSPPRIALQITAPDVYLHSDTIPVAGTVSADSCVQSVQVYRASTIPGFGTQGVNLCTNSVGVSGQSANLTGSGGQVSFDSPLSFAAAGASDVPVLVRATDCQAAYACAQFTAHLDNGPPVLSIPGLTPGSTPNDVSKTPFTITGTVTDLDLVGLTANSQSLSATPGSAAGAWDFVLDVAVSRVADQSLTFEAWDRAGNRVSQAYLLHLTSTFDVEIISPPDGARLFATGTSHALQATARAVGMAAGDTLEASLDGAPAVPMPRSGDVGNLAYNVSVDANDHTLQVLVRDSQGAQVGAAVSRFNFIDAASVPLEVVSVEPANGAADIEANVPISVAFNRPVDPTTLEFKVVETFHGKIYAKQAEGADLSTLSMVDMVQVDRDLTVVPGGAQNLPGNRLFAFYPSQDYAYGGEVFIELLAGGTTIHRSTFRVRPLPTLVHGFVSSTSVQPLGDIDVFFPSLNRSVTTNGDGNWSLGFGDAADAMLPPGRQRVLINPGNRNPDYASVERLMHIEASRFNYVGMTQLAKLDFREPYRHVVSGQDDAAVLAGGDLILDLSETTLVFPDGATEGDVHAQFIGAEALSHPAIQSALPSWAFGIQPVGIKVEGHVGIRIKLPKVADSYAYLATLPNQFVILGLDDDDLNFVPIGVGRIDRTTNELISEGVVAAERLDYIGISTRIVIAELFRRYIDGEIELGEMIRIMEQFQ